MPGANQYVVFGFMSPLANAELLPAATVTAPAGAAAGPLRSPEFPQIADTGEVGAGPAGTAGVGAGVGAGAAEGVGAGVGRVLAETDGAGPGHSTR